MKIIRLEAENVKRIRAIEIEPDGSTVVIAGRNGQGKTSVLDSIWLALGGGSAARETARPVRDGQKEAKVRLDLGELVVTRTWNAKTMKTKLTVDSKEGARYSSPQAMLDDLVGSLSFDPLGFSQLPAREQRATLLGLIALPFKPEELEAERQGIYDARRENNRTITQLEGHLAEMPDPPEGLPDEEISTASVLAEYNAAQKRIRENDAVRNARSHAAVEVDRRLIAVGQAEEALRIAQAKHEEAVAGYASASEAESALKPDPDLSVFETTLASADEVNAQLRAGRARAQVVADLASAAEISKAMTEKLDAIEARKVEAIEAAKMPVEGLSFDSDGVLYQGVPFKQSSAAEQLRVSLAMAMAMNPSIRVIRITDGSLLDSTNMALIEGMAEAEDYQVWIERVDESGSVGITIEDGAVVATAEPEEVPA